MMSIIGEFIFEMIFSAGLVTIGFVAGLGWELHQRLKREAKDAANKRD